jgi:hypothetical protein
MHGGNGRDRRVRIDVHWRRISVDSAGHGQASLSYPGVLLTGYENGEKVCERWVPLGPEPSEADDERLIQALHGAWLWQHHQPSPWCPS